LNAQFDDGEFLGGQARDPAGKVIFFGPGTPDNSVMGLGPKSLEKPEVYIKTLMDMKKLCEDEEHCGDHEDEEEEHEDEEHEDEEHEDEEHEDEEHEDEEHEDEEHEDEEHEDEEHEDEKHKDEEEHDDERKEWKDIIHDLREFDGTIDAGVFINGAWEGAKLYGLIFVEGDLIAAAAAWEDDDEYHIFYRNANKCMLLLQFPTEHHPLYLSRY
jgi:hypothetical protein